MGYSAYLKPRQEAISEEGIEGIIDLANLRDESNAKQKKRNQIICKHPQLLCGIHWNKV